MQGLEKSEYTTYQRIIVNTLKFPLVSMEKMKGKKKMII